MLIWGLQFGVGEISWGLEFRGPKCAICGLKFGVNEIVWGLVCPCPSHFLSIKQGCLEFYDFRIEQPESMHERPASG